MLIMFATTPPDSCAGFPVEGNPSPSRHAIHFGVVSKMAFACRREGRGLAEWTTHGSAGKVQESVVRK